MHAITNRSLILLMTFALVGLAACTSPELPDFNEGDDVTGMALEHYPGMTEKALAAIEAEAMERAVHYLSYRPRTCREVRRYLGKHGLSGHADPAIDRCIELGYLNDEAYARAFVRERVRLKPRGRPRFFLTTQGIGPTNLRAVTPEPATLPQAQRYSLNPQGRLPHRLRPHAWTA